MSVVPILQESSAYKPHKYQWAIEAWEKQQSAHWMSKEVPMGEDVKDWRKKLTDEERNFLTKVFRFFTQADIDVASGYTKHFIQKFPRIEIKMMLLAFAAMETVHIEAYASLIETLGMPDSEFSEFLSYKEMREKHTYLERFNMNTDRDVLITLAAYGAFTEGLQLYGTFAMLLNFQRRGLMKGMGQVVAWSVRDESLHADSMIRLFRTYAIESGLFTEEIKDDILGVARESVRLEEGFIDLCFSMGKQVGITAEDTKKYVRYLCDHRLKQLGFEPIFKERNPFDWIQATIQAREHTNFFENKATEYSKGSMSGQWSANW